MAMSPPSVVRRLPLRRSSRDDELVLSTDEKEKFPRLVPVHGPVHTSWLNQIEIYFSIVTCADL